MNSQKTSCRLCFPDGDQPQCRSFETSISAMRNFSALFDDNRMPTMCHGNDGRYRVCYQIQARHSAPVAPFTTRTAAFAGT